MGWKAPYLSRSYEETEGSSHCRTPSTALLQKQLGPTLPEEAELSQWLPQTTGVSTPRICKPSLQCRESRNLPRESNIWSQASLQHRLIPH